MTITPITQSVTVNAPPARCFELFTSRMGDWWPKDQTLSKGPYKTLVIEPKAGGRWYETDSTDKVLQWGNVLDWEPPHRLLLAWRLNSSFAYDPTLMTEVEITFKAAGAGKTQMTLEHRDLEKLGKDAEKFTAMLAGGWAGHLKTVAKFIESQK